MTCPHGAPSRWRCRPCTAAYMAVYMRAYRRPSTRPRRPLQDGVLRVLRAHPDGLGSRAIADRLGARNHPWDIVSAVRRLRRRGVVVETVGTPRAARYRLPEGT